MQNEIQGLMISTLQDFFRMIHGMVHGLFGKVKRDANQALSAKEEVRQISLENKMKHCHVNTTKSKLLTVLGKN